MKLFAGLLLLLYSISCVAQYTCVITGPSGFTGPVSSCSGCTATCGGAPPPPPPPPPTGCSASQLSTALGSRTFQRQCSGQVAIMPSTIVYNGTLTDLGTVLGGSSFPAYKYAGYSPTFTITSGFYVALAFTPSTTGSFQLVANTSYGDGGTISLSTVPGAITKGASGAICVQNTNAGNSLYMGTSTSTCRLTVGTTYFINFVDTNINGDLLCYNGSPGSCAQSTVSYTLYR